MTGHITNEMVEMRTAIFLLSMAASIVVHRTLAFALGYGGGRGSLLFRRGLSVRHMSGASEDPHVDTILFVECGTNSTYQQNEVFRPVTH
jgi:hypothetical protein